MENSNEENIKSQKKTLNFTKPNSFLNKNFDLGSNTFFSHENIQVGGSSVELGSLIQTSFGLES